MGTIRSMTSFAARAFSNVFRVRLNDFVISRSVEILSALILMGLNSFVSVVTTLSLIFALS